MEQKNDDYLKDFLNGVDAIFKDFDEFIKDSENFIAKDLNDYLNNEQETEKINNEKETI